VSVEVVVPLGVVWRGSLLETGISLRVHIPTGKCKTLSLCVYRQGITARDKSTENYQFA